MVTHYFLLSTVLLACGASQASDLSYDSSSDGDIVDRELTNCEEVFRANSITFLDSVKSNSPKISSQQLDAYFCANPSAMVLKLSDAALLKRYYDNGKQAVKTAQ